ncbi:MAG: TetR/AcrR family transcriptional regulator [Clostridia bacterium]|nr:TetR/AcrR family transcriptional regulator [Clostridia bacterium]
MQYKKEHVRSRILQAAKESFFNCGFYGSSIKDIALAAAVPVGNLYRYFDSKIALLDGVVKSCYERVIKRIAKEDEFSIESVLKHVGYEVSHSRTELIILAYKCGGTKYGDFLDKISHEVKLKVKSSLKNNEKSSLLDAIVTSTVVSIFELIRNSYDKNLEENISKLLAFMTKEINHII